MAFAVYFYFEDQKDEAAKAVALSQDPPAAVDVASFSREANLGPADEVVLQGQIDHTARYTLTRKKKRSESTSWIIPLYPSDATERPEAVDFVLLGDADEVPMQKLLEFATSLEGDRPTVEINGVLTRPGKFRSMVSEAMQEQGMSLASNAVFVEPFLEGREAGLSANKNGPTSSLIIGGLGLLLFLYGFLRRNARRKAQGLGA